MRLTIGVVLMMLGWMALVVGLFRDWLGPTFQEWSWRDRPLVPFAIASMLLSEGLVVLLA